MNPQPCTVCGLVGSTLLNGMCSSCYLHSHPTTPESHLLRYGSDTASPATIDEYTASESAALPQRGYTIGEQIGHGGIGRVHKATDLSTGRTVAIKLLHPKRACPNAIRRIVAEAKAQAELSHANVVHLYEFVPDAKDPYLVMEYVNGASLAKLCSQQKVSPTTAAKIIATAAHGVHAAHQKGIIHQDLKPGNILVSQSGEVKVADFGMARRIGRDQDVQLIGRVIGGTPGFLSPEQINGSGDGGDARTDVWGLGATLYTVLVGQPPYPPNTKCLSEVINEPLALPRTLVSGIPSVLEAIVCKCLEKNPDLRYQTAEELAQDLERFLSGEPTVAQPLRWRERVWQRVRRIPQVSVAAYAMSTLAVALMLAVVSLSPGGFTRAAQLPIDPHTLYRKAFLADRTVTLVGNTGLPSTRPDDWVFGRSNVTTSPLDDGSAYIQTFGAGGLKLFDPPGDRYLVEFDLRHVSAARDNAPFETEVGIFFHAQRTHLPGNITVDSFLLVSFCDYDLGQRVPGKLPTPQRVRASARDYYRLAPGRSVSPSNIGLNSGKPTFSTAAHLPGTWRKMILECTPEGFRVFWQNDAEDLTDQPILVVEKTAKELERYLQIQRDCVKHMPQVFAVHNPKQLSTEWNPTHGFGVWANCAGLAFRNVVVRRLPPEGK